MILTDDLIPDSPTSMAEQQPGNDFFFFGSTICYTVLVRSPW